MSRVLPVAIPIQEQSNWCWAAVSLGVHRFYFVPGAFQQQCQVAALFSSGCCVNPAPCNVQRRLETALQGVRCLSGLPIAGALTPAVLIQQVEVLGRPVCAHIGWLGGGPQHFVAITGCAETGGLTLTIQDPLRGELTYDYSHFVNRYQEQGVWDFSYLTIRSV